MTADVRVLIADDQPAVRASLRTFLELQPGLSVVGEAADGLQAVELAARTCPDVVLMDLAMPGLDGAAAAQRVRLASPHTRVLVVTSFGDDARVYPALGAGAAGYVLKDTSPEELLRAIDAVHRGEPYLHPSVTRRLMDSVTPPSRVEGTATVLFTDIEGSTQLVSDLGDVPARAIFREHDRLLRLMLREHGGSEVKHLGDGIMAVFASARRALTCAVEIQRRVASDEGVRPVRVRIGVNTGEVIAEEHDYFGQTVILAARLASAATGGQILASESTKSLSEDAGFRFLDRGARELKGLGERQMFEVVWDPEAV